MADIRSIEEIRNQPCKYKLKDMTSKLTTPKQNEVVEGGVRKIKKVIQKTDENGTPLFKTIKIEKKKGCGCKKNRKTEIIEKRVPDTITVWVEEEIQEKTKEQIEKESVIQQVTETHQALCKLYGTVPESYCRKCKTYKKQR